MKNDHDHDEKKTGLDRGVTRRKFLKTMGSGAAIAAASDALTDRGTAEAEVIKPEVIVRMNLIINGLRRRLVVEPHWSLLYVLREKLGLTGTKTGCERGKCGACTVLIDELPHYACLTLAVEVQGTHIVTLRGLMHGEKVGAVQQAFAEYDAAAVLNLKEIPKKLLVIGGGYIGLELGTVYAALGTKVTVVEMTPGLLPGADRDLVKVLQKRLASRMTAILLQTTVKSLKVQKNGIKATLEGPDVDQNARIFDKVLLAVGRRPNSAGLGLANTTIEVDGRGFIKVDAQRRTAEKHIFAIGDVAGESMRVGGWIC